MEWIKTKDELPEKEVGRFGLSSNVLFAWDAGYGQTVTYGYYEAEQNVWFSVEKSDETDDPKDIVHEGYVTHWMKIPQPPIKKKKK